MMTSDACTCDPLRARLRCALSFLFRRSNLVGLRAWIRRTRLCMLWAVQTRPHLRPISLASPRTTRLTIDLTTSAKHVTKHPTSCARRCLYSGFLRAVTLLDTVEGSLVIMVSMLMLYVCRLLSHSQRPPSATRVRPTAFSWLRIIELARPPPSWLEKSSWLDPGRAGSKSRASSTLIGPAQRVEPARPRSSWHNPVPARPPSSQLEKSSWLDRVELA